RPPRSRATAVPGRSEQSRSSPSSALFPPASVSARDGSSDHIDCASVGGSRGEENTTWDRDLYIARYRARSDGGGPCVEKAGKTDYSHAHAKHERLGPGNSPTSGLLHAGGSRRESRLRRRSAGQ